MKLINNLPKIINFSIKVYTLKLHPFCLTELGKSLSTSGS